MKSLLVRSIFVFALPCTVSQQAGATLLAGFYDFDNGTANEAADETAVGVSGQLIKPVFGGDSFSTGGSFDGTYGNITIPAPGGQPTGNGVAMVYGLPVTFTVTNNSVVEGYQFSGLYFDAAGLFSNETLQVQFRIDAGLLPVVPLTTLGSVGVPMWSSSDYADYGFGLSSLSLQPGQTISFLFSATNGVSVDNVAIVAIPEPASLIALGCVVGSGFFLRRRHRVA